MKSFEQWYKNINEDLAADPVAEPTIATEIEVETPRDAMMHDVDSIMTSLETLAAELKESLEAEVMELNEASGDKPNLVMQYLFYTRPLVKQQLKINNMKLKESDMEIAAAKLQSKGETEKQGYLVDKAKQLTQNIKEIQAQVNDMAEQRGSYVEKRVKKVRLEGDLAVVRSQIGNIGDSKEMKDRMKDIMDKMKEEDIAIQDMTARAESEALEGDDAKYNRAKEARDKFKQGKEKIDKMPDGIEKELALAEYNAELAKLDAQVTIHSNNPKKDLKATAEKVEKAEAKLAEVKAKAAQAASNTTEEPAQTTSNTTEEPAQTTSNNQGTVGQDDGADGETKKEREVKNAKQGKLDRVEKMIKDEQEKLTKANPESKKIQDEIERLEGELAKANPNPKDKKAKEGQEILKQTIENQKEKLALARLKNSSPKLDKLKQLKKDILAKENWQIEGTELGRIFEMRIVAFENESILNESVSLSIKERFQRLI